MTRQKTFFSEKPDDSRCENSTQRLTRFLSLMMLQDRGVGVDLDERRRVAMLAGVSLTGSATLLFFGIVSIVQGAQTLGFINLSVCLLVLLNLFVIRMPSGIEFNFHVAIAIALGFYIFLYLTGGYNNTGFVWYYTFPLLASYLLGARRGLVASLLLLLPVGFFIFAEPQGDFFAVYSKDFQLRFAISYLVVSLFSYSYEYSSQLHRDEIRRVNRSLEEIVVQRTGQLKESEKRYRTMVEKSVNGIWLADMASGRLMDINPAVEHLLQCSKDEILKNTMKDLFGDVVAADLVERHKDQEVVVVDDVEIKRPDTSVRIVVVSSVNLGNGQLMGIFRDVTRLREMEAESEKLQRRLLQAEKMEAIGNLAGGIAHDFNNILVALLGFTELCIEDAEKDTEQYENLQEIYHAAMRASKLVRQILTFARQSDIVLVPVDLSDIVSEVVELLRSTLPATITLTADVEDDVTVKADAIQMYQVIMNLCTNSVQAMNGERGEIHLHLYAKYLDQSTASTKYGVEEGNYAVISVTDNGPGIDDDIIRYIFEPYFTTKAVGKGTGMGLSVVQGIVENCSGTIQVDSAAAKQTVFTILLPQYAGTAQKDAIAEEHALLKEGVLNGLRVLLVDDEPSVVSAHERFLKKMGCQVDSFTEGQKALTFFSRSPQKYDIVITDMTMPGKTGLEIAREIHSARTDVPILLCTGNSQDVDRQRAKEAGVSALVSKPFTHKEFVSRVLSVIN